MKLNEIKGVGRGYEVLDLVRRAGSTKQKSDLMMTLAQVARSHRLEFLLQAYLEKQQPFEALDMCNDMQRFFAEKGGVARAHRV